MASGRRDRDQGAHRGGSVVKVEIRSRWDNSVMYSTEVDDADPCPLRTALDGANLDGANLTDANLAHANLAHANLARANLIDANLARANLIDANLIDANLIDANLAGANFTGANFTGANLAGANLTGANLDGANLTDANLTDANLAGIRDDFHARLDCVPGEVAGLLAKMEAGEVDGTCYEGVCCCFVGTIACLRGVKFDAVVGLAPSSSSPTERWFTGISRGATPNSNPIAAITADWIREWQAERGQVVNDRDSLPEVPLPSLPET